MKSILIVFFIASFLLMILVFPFKVRAMIHIDLIKMKCFYCFKVWRIKVLCGRASIDDAKEVIIENSDNLFSVKLEKKFALILVKQLLKRIEFKKFELYFTGGFVEDSYSSAIVCGSMYAITKILYSVLTQVYDDVKVYEDISPTFKESNFNLTINVGLKISLLSILISLIKSDKIKTKKVKMEVADEN